MKFIKNNWLPLFFLFLGVLLSFKIYRECDQFLETEKRVMEQAQEMCFKNQEEPLDPEMEKYCSMYIPGNMKLERTDFYLKFQDIALSNYIIPISFLAPLILISISLLKVTSIFKNRTCFYMLKRERYSKFLKKLFLNAYKWVGILVFIMLMVILACSIHSTCDPNVLSKYGLLWDFNLLTKPWLFIFLYLLNILFHSAFYINLGLLIARKQHNYLIAIIESFLLVIAIELFLEVGIGGILFGKILNNYSASLIFNILNLFVFNIAESKFGVMGILLFSFSCFFLSSIAVYFFYQNKEKLVIDCEKNN